MQGRPNLPIVLVACLLLCIEACSVSHFDRPSKQVGVSKPVAPEGMIYIPAGKVKVTVYERRHKHGAWLADRETERVERGFFIDKYEYPNVEGEFPLNNVSFVEAESACAQLGKRLCTMREWLKACQGPKRWRYCYGDRYDETCCNAVEEDNAQLERSGSRECCKSGYGVYDMTGNLWEWTSEPVVRRYCGHTTPDARVQLGMLWDRRAPFPVRQAEHGQD